MPPLAKGGLDLFLRAALGQSLKDWMRERRPATLRKVFERAKIQVRGGQDSGAANMVPSQLVASLVANPSLLQNEGPPERLKLMSRLMPSPVLAILKLASRPPYMSDLWSTQVCEGLLSAPWNSETQYEMTGKDILSGLPGQKTHQGDVHVEHDFSDEHKVRVLVCKYHPFGEKLVSNKSHCRSRVVTVLLGRVWHVLLPPSPRPQRCRCRLHRL